MSKIKKYDFEQDDFVLYVPTHAFGDLNHNDCQKGIVKRVSKNFVFVQYYRYGIWQSTYEATDPKDLKKYGL